MAAEDWYYDYEPDPWDDDEGVKCKYCGTPDLEWVELPQGWRLYNADGELHRCKRPKDDPADAFGPAPTTCRYTKGKSDGYGTNWGTACDQAARQQPTGLYPRRMEPWPAADPVP